MARFQLNPNETAQENLWRCATAATAYIFAKSKVTNTGSEYKELFDQVVMEGVAQFLEFKIRQHKYNRDYDFWTNVHSSCWSAYSNVLRLYIKGVRRKIVTDSADECIGETGITVLDNIPDTGKHALSGYPKYSYGNPIIPQIEREQFGFSDAALPVRSEPQKCLEALWELDDRDNGGLVTIDELQRRHAILDRLPQPKRKSLYNREYQRKRRSKMK